MSRPSLDYDDETVLPKINLKNKLETFTQELNKVKRIFHQYVPGEFPLPPKFEKELQLLRQSADAVGVDCRLIMDKLIADYVEFQKAPEQSNLDRIFKDINSLELLLIY